MLEPVESKRPSLPARALLRLTPLPVEGVVVHVAVLVVQEHTLCIPAVGTTSACSLVELQLVGFGWNEAASLATIAAVCAAVYQLRQARRSLRDNFERTFVDRYERIIKDVNLEVMLRGQRPDLSDPETERAFYDYFTLTEEELYFRAHQRVSTSTWRDWWYGIRLHLQNEAFMEAFEHLHQSSKTGRQPGQPERFSYLLQAVKHIHHDRYEPVKGARSAAPGDQVKDSARSTPQP